MRLRSLLGVSLEELKTLVEAEEARKILRAEIETGVDDPERLREMLSEALGHLDLQLGLVQRRAEELQGLQADLEERRRRVKARLRALPQRPERRDEPQGVLWMTLRIAAPPLSWMRKYQFAGSRNLIVRPAGSASAL